MLKNYIGILSAIENKENLRRLTAHRAVASIPLAGKYRVVDFMLSNMSNAGITTLGIFTDNDSRSLRDHVGTGRAWELNRRHGGIFMFSFNRSMNANYDVQMLKDNLEFLYKAKEENVIFSSTYMIANLDLKAAVAAHESSGRDITVIYKRANDADKNFLNCDVLSMDTEGRVTDVAKNLGDNPQANICTEIFIMKKELLLTLIEKCAYIDYAYNMKAVIYENIGKLVVKGFEYKGYLACINSLLSYYKTNMDMLSVDVTKELFFNDSNPIYSKSKDSPPTRYYDGSVVQNALVANGCIIKGTVKHSIVSRYTVIEEGAEVENCILLQNCTIKSGVKIKNVIIDKNVTLDAGTELKGSDIYPLVIEKEIAHR